MKAWSPKVIQISALLGAGVDRFWDEVTHFKAAQQSGGEFAARRQHQALSWMWERIEAGLRQAFRQSAQVKELLPRMMEDVEQGRIAASTAARRLLDLHKDTENKHA